VGLKNLKSEPKLAIFSIVELTAFFSWIIMSIASEYSETAVDLLIGSTP
jgi:hypothetical protein